MVVAASQPRHEGRKNCFPIVLKTELLPGEHHMILILTQYFSMEALHVALLSGDRFKFSTRDGNWFVLYSLLVKVLPELATKHV